MGCNDSKQMKQNVQGSRTENKHYSSYTKNNGDSTIQSNQSNSQNGPGKGSRLTPFYYELQNMYRQSQGDIKKFIKMIEQKVSMIYMDISSSTLTEMNHQQIAANQSKIIISQEILTLNLNVLKVIGRSHNFQYDENTFKQLNKFQKNLVGYLKIKYPRGTQNFVSGDLMTIFKEFDRSEDLEYDILKKSNTCFRDTNDGDLSKSVKIFLNKIINQLDAKFPIFQKLMQERAFSVINQKGEKASLNYKIGRKISQNVPLYQKLDTGTLQINSPQIFRVLIKWMQDMEATIMEPDQKINKKQNFKCFTGVKQNGIIQFDYINQYEHRQLINEDLINRIEDSKPEYEKKKQSLMKQLDTFNSTLLKVLNHIDVKQKYIPMKQMEIIKYSNLNAKFVAYMLAEKIVFSIKKFIEIGNSFKSQTMMVMDLIKFRLSDLMRCMILGTKKQIVQVFNNFKRLQSQGLIQIIKIKNRLTTPLNDAMIIFVIKQSYLVCEAQLILSEGAGQRIDKKGKNVELINHFFYELQRSPYGIMAQIAVLLAYKDSKISYEQKITFEQTKLDFQNCRRNHRKQCTQCDYQIKPFICTKCSSFYNKSQNLFVYYECKICKYTICSKCIIKAKPSLQTQFIMKNIQRQIQQKIQGLSKQKQKNGGLNAQGATVLVDYSKSLSAKDILAVFNPQKQKVKQVLGGSNRTHAQKLMKNIAESTMKNFVIANFTKGQADFNCYRYASQDKQIQNPFDYKQKYEEKSQFYCSDYDILLSLKLNVNFVKSKKLQDKHLFIFVSFEQYQSRVSQIQKAKKQGKIKNEDEYEIISVKLDNQNLLVLDYCQAKKSAQKDIVYNDEYGLKTFKYPSLHVFVQKLPDLKTAKTIVQFDQLGLDTTHLSFFKQIKWNSYIKEIKIAQNKITEIDMIVQNCPNLQRLYIGQNFIKNLCFKKMLPNLQILNASENQIQKVQGLRFINKIKKLLLQRNVIEEFPKCSQLAQLNILNLKANYLKNIKNILDSKLPELQQLLIGQQNEYYNQEQGQQQRENTQHVFNIFGKNKKQDQIQIGYPKLKYFESQANPSILSGKTIQIKSHYLQKITLYGCAIAKIHFSDNKCIQNVKFLRLSQNDLSSFAFLDPNDKGKSFNDSQNGSVRSAGNEHDRVYHCNNLVDFDMSQNKIQMLPILKFFSLKQLNLSYNNIKDIKPLSRSKIPELQSLLLSNNFIQEVCPLYFSKLKQISFSCNPSIKNLAQIFSNSSQLGNLQNIEAQYCDKIDFNFRINKNNNNLLKLKSLNFSGCTFVQPEKDQKTEPIVFQIQSLQQLYLNNCTFDKFPQMNLSKLTLLYLTNSNAISFKRLQKCRFNSLATMDLNNLKERQIIQPDEIVPENQVNQSTNQSSNKKKVPFDSSKYLSCEFNYPSLNCLTLDNCEIGSIKGLQNSNLPKLEELYMKVCKTGDSKLPKLNFSNLKLIDGSYTPIINLDILLGSNLKKLETMNFISSSIQYLSDNTIGNLQNLKYVELGYNKLTKFSCSKYLDNLMRLNISNNKITSYPRIKAKQLKDLNLSDNTFLDIDELQNSDMPLIEEISLRDCDFSKSAFPKLNMLGLKKLTVIGCKISNISNLAKSNIPQVSLIDFSNNQLETFPPIQFSKLRDLRLGDNNLNDTKWLEKSKLPYLNTLVLNKNNLPKYPQNFDYPNLKKFWCNDIPIRKLPMLDLPAVNLLQFQRCELENIDQFANGEYPQVTQFSVRGNKLQNLPKLYMPALVSGFFLDNQLEDVSDFCDSYLPNINMISFENNKLVVIPSLAFITLKSVYFTNNPLIELKCFSMPSYDNMEMIVASNTQLTKIPNLPKMPALKQLWISKSQIQDLGPIKKVSENCPTLEVLALFSSRIKKVPFEITGFKNLKQLYLQLNPINEVDGSFIQTFINQLSTFKINLDMNATDFQKIKAKILKKNTQTQVNLYVQA